jgi:hypothetical protein
MLNKGYKDFKAFNNLIKLLIKSFKIFILYLFLKAF